MDLKRKIGGNSYQELPGAKSALSQEFFSGMPQAQFMASVSRKIGQLPVPITFTASGSGKPSQLSVLITFTASVSNCLFLSVYTCNLWFMATGRVVAVVNWSWALRGLPTCLSL